MDDVPPLVQRFINCTWLGARVVEAREQDAVVAYIDRLRAAQPAVPDAVMRALDRMCTPLDQSMLNGATADADARSMKVIRDYILGSAVKESLTTAQAQPKEPQP